MAQIVQSFTKNCSEYFDFYMKQNVYTINSFLVNDLTEKLTFLVQQNTKFQLNNSRIIKNNICQLCSQEVRQIDVTITKKQLQNDASNRISLMKKLCNDFDKQEELFSIEQDRNFFKLLNRRLMKKEQAVQVQSKDIASFIEEMAKSVNDLNFLTQYTPTNIDFSAMNSSYQGTLQSNFRSSLQKNFKSKFPPWIQKLFHKLRQIILKSLKKNQIQFATQTQIQKVQTTLFLKEQISKYKKQNQQLKLSIEQLQKIIFNHEHKVKFMQRQMKNSQHYYIEEISKLSKQKKLLQGTILKNNQKTPKKMIQSTVKIQQDIINHEIKKQTLRQDLTQSMRKNQQQLQRKKMKKKKKIANLSKKSSKMLNSSNQINIFQQKTFINLENNQNNITNNQNRNIYSHEQQQEVQSSQKIVNFLKNVKLKSKKSNVQSIKNFKMENEQKQSKNLSNAVQKKSFSKKQLYRHQISKTQNMKQNINLKQTQNSKKLQKGTINHKRGFSVQKDLEKISKKQILNSPPQNTSKKLQKRTRLIQRPSIALNLSQQQLQKQVKFNVDQIITVQNRQKFAQIGYQLQNKALQKLKSSAKHLPNQMKQYVNIKIRQKKKTSYFHRQSSLQNEVQQGDKKQQFVFKQEKIDQQTQTEYQQLKQKELDKNEKLSSLQPKNQKKFEGINLQIIDQAEQYHRKKMLDLLKKQNLVPGDLSISHYQLLIKKIFPQNQMPQIISSQKHKSNSKSQLNINHKNQQKSLILSLPKVEKTNISKLSKTGRQNIKMNWKLNQKSQGSLDNTFLYCDEYSKSKQIIIFNQKDFKLFLDEGIAYEYETRSKNNFHKKRICQLTHSQIQFLQSLFKMISLIRDKNIQVYNKVCSFIRYPYQTIKNSFQIVNIAKQMSYQSFTSYFQKILGYHRECEKKQNKFCSHFDQFVQKISQLVVICSK